MEVVDAGLLNVLDALGLAVVVELPPGLEEGEG